MSGTLALASAIAEMERPALRALVRSRHPQSLVSILDPIGLASELLRPDSVLRAVSRLSRSELDVLLGLGGVRVAGQAPRADDDALDSLAAQGLVGLEAGTRVALPEVTAAIEEGLAGAGQLGSDDSLEAPGHVDRPATAGTADGWVDTALSAVGRCAECLRQLLARPVKLNRTGVVSYAGAKSIAERTGIEVSLVQSAVEILGLAGLTARASDDQLLVASGAAQRWLDSGMTARFVVLASGALGTLSAQLRAVLAVHGGNLRLAADRISLHFPLLPEDERAAAAQAAELADAMGLSVNGRLTEPVSLLLADRADEATARVDAAMPDNAPGVYLQPDLSVIVPGPLPPVSEAELAELTVPEHIGIASTRRVTEGAVTEALERGLTAEEARSTFARLSLTGVPQPLDYLITSLAERVGSIVVTEYDGEPGRSRIAVSREQLADTLLVDRALQHLQLRRSDSEPLVLFSRLRSEHVVAALADARYHATVPGGREPRLSSGHEGSTRAGITPGKAADPRDQAGRDEMLDALVERVFASARTEPGTGDFTRRIELAIRERRAVLVTAESGGQSRSFTLLPVSVNGGRLRASDQAAGVERTLPVSLITSVEPVELH